MLKSNAELVKLKDFKEKSDTSGDTVLHEENLLMKQIIKEKDSIIKKLKDANARESVHLELEKKAADEAVANVTQENAKLLEKRDNSTSCF